MISDILNQLIVGVFKKNHELFTMYPRSLILTIAMKYICCSDLTSGPNPNRIHLLGVDRGTAEAPPGANAGSNPGVTNNASSPNQGEDYQLKALLDSQSTGKMTLMENTTGDYMQWNKAADIGDRTWPGGELITINYQGQLNPDKFYCLRMEPSDGNYLYSVPYKKEENGQNFTRTTGLETNDPRYETPQSEQMFEEDKERNNRRPDKNSASVYFVGTTVAVVFAMLTIL